MSNNLEAKARIKINKLLEEAGWRFFDTNEGKANIHLESHIKFDDLGDDFQKAKGGFIDFLLLDTNNNPLVVLEAKSEKIEPLFAKEQARKYALVDIPTKLTPPVRSKLTPQSYLQNGVYFS
jgi:type I restriction enzyme R subunit